MKSIWVLLLLVSFYFTLPTNYSLAHEEAKTVHIVIGANKSQPPEFDQIIALAKSNLDSYNLKIEINLDNPPWPEQFIMMNVASNSKSVLISPLSSKEFSLPTSPILYPNFVTPNCCSGGIYILFNEFTINQNTISTIADFITGLGLYQTANYEGCETYLKASLQLLPSISLGRTGVGVKSYINFYRANCAIMRDDLQEAHTIMELTNEFCDIECMINLAWLDLQLNRQEDAIKIISTIAPPYHDSDFLSRRAQLYSLAERYDDAFSDLNTAIEMSPDDPELYALRGQTYLYLYEWDSVLADYNKALELDPDYADAYFLRGVLYYSILQTGTENYPLALSDFQHYLELAPDGEHAAEATKYADQIQTQQEALNS